MPDLSRFNTGSVVSVTVFGATSKLRQLLQAQALRQIARSKDVSKVSWRSSSRAKGMEWPS
jgi:hypothetical protein